MWAQEGPYCVAPEKDYSPGSDIVNIVETKSFNYCNIEVVGVLKRLEGYHICRTQWTGHSIWSMNIGKMSIDN